MNTFRFSRVFLPLLLGGVLLMLALLLFSLPFGVQAKPELLSTGIIRYVSPAGDDAANPCVTAVSPCRTVQHAIDVAQDGEEVRITRGVYTSTLGTVAFITKSITVQGGWDDFFVAYDPDHNFTLLEGQLMSSTIVITNPITAIPTEMVNVNIAGLTVGNSSELVQAGGGIYNNGTLSVGDTTITNTTALAGGGIYNSGTMIISDTTITHCRGLEGVGIFSRGALTIPHSIVSNNNVVSVHGGPSGIKNQGTMFIQDSLIEHNTAFAYGGIRNEGTLTITNSTISHNRAQFVHGGISNLGDLTILNSTIVGNEAIETGGIANYGRLAIANSTVYSNTSVESGGGIYNGLGGTLVISNSTLSDNKASAGGGIALGEGLVTLYNVTVANNVADQGSGAAGGIQRDTGYTGTVVLHNTIVAGNLRLEPNGTVPADCMGEAGAFISGGYNLIGSAEGCNWSTASGDQVGSDAAPINPQLAALADNGGPTLTHGLLPGSPAINLGNSSTCPATDQRGLLRWDGRCDMGAYEYNALSFIPAAFLYLPALAK